MNYTEKVNFFNDLKENSPVLLTTEQKQGKII